MGLLSDKAVNKRWIICPKCRVNIPKINKHSGINSNAFLLEFECTCYERIFQMSLLSYRHILNSHYADDNLSISIKSVAACFICKSNDDLFTYCIECIGFLCGKCFPFHSQNYSHNYAKSQIVIDSKCEMHKQVNTLYCSTCEKEICFKCRGKEITHSEHLVHSIKDYCKASKDKWIKNSVHSISTELNSSSSNENKDFLSFLELLYDNYETLIEKPSINITKSITSLQSEIASLCLKSKQHNSAPNHQDIPSIVSPSKTMHTHLYKMQYEKPSNKIKLIDSCITLLIVLQDGRYAYVLRERDHSTPLSRIAISSSFYLPLMIIEERQDEIVDLLEFNYNTLVSALRIGRIDFWKISSKERITSILITSSISSIIKLKEERIGVTGKGKGSIWNTKTNEKTFSLASGSLVSFNENIFISYKKSIQIRDFSQNTIVSELTEYTTSIAFVGKINSKRIISSSIDGIIKIWNIKRKKSILSIPLKDITIEKGMNLSQTDSICLITHSNSILIFNYTWFQINLVIQMHSYIVRVVQINTNRLCCSLNINQLQIISC